VPGWSTHIEPRGDQLVALGVDDTEGRKVSVSLFDVADPSAPTLLDRVSFGGQWAWSSAYGDVKALTVLDDVVIVPVSGWNETLGQYDRLQFVALGDDALTLGGRVDLQGTILRSFAYGGSYYGVTSEQLAGFTADSTFSTIQSTGTLTLAEYVADYMELDASTAAQVITRNAGASTVVRTVDASGTALGETTVALSGYETAFVFGESQLALVGIAWNPDTYESEYEVAVVDCSNAAAPTVTAARTIDVTPYYSRFYWWYGPEMMDYGMDALYYWPPYWQPDEIALIAGDSLVLRCYASSYDNTVGTVGPSEGLAVVDITDSQLAARTLGLGFADVTSVDVVDDMVYLGTKESVETIGVEAPLCAYFLQTLDIGTGTLGPAANVPGLFVQYDPETDVLVLEDAQWRNPVWAGDVNASLESVIWDGTGAVTAADSLALPQWMSNPLGRGDRIYFEYYDTAYSLRVATVAGNGALGLGAAVPVTDSWSWLVAANDSSAYMSIGNGLIGRYDFSGAPALGELVEVMGTPLSIRFGSNQAYAALGYFGASELPL